MQNSCGNWQIDAVYAAKLWQVKKREKPCADTMCCTGRTVKKDTWWYDLTWLYQRVLRHCCTILMLRHCYRTTMSVVKQ